MSDRDKEARERLNKKYVKEKVTTGADAMLKSHGQLVEIQADFEADMVPVSFIIIDYENIYFAKPSITIDEMLTSESLRKRVNEACEGIGINTAVLDAPSITPMINYSYTIQQWININSSNSAYIIFRSKSDLRNRQNEQQQKKENVIQSEPPIITGPVYSTLDFKKINEQLKVKIDAQNSKIDELLQWIKQINEKTDEQNVKIGAQNVRIGQQDSEIKSLKLDVHSLCIAIKPLTNLNKRILVEKFRLYLVRKYSALFKVQTGVSITAETKYRDVYQYMTSFLNELHQGISSSLITSEREKQCLQQALSHVGSYYQVISDKFIHEATKENIAESILRSDTTNKQIWINMYKIVYNEEPDLIDTLLDAASIPENDNA